MPSILNLFHHKKQMNIKFEQNFEKKQLSSADD